MTTKTVKFDKEGKKILPEVFIGDERIEASSSAVSGVMFVCCAEHGNAPCAWVRLVTGSLRKCCRKCIHQHCKMTTAVRREIYLADGSEAHPNGHSY